MSEQIIISVHELTDLCSETPIGWCIHHEEWRQKHPVKEAVRADADRRGGVND
jgi:hypothetical protein